MLAVVWTILRRHSASQNKLNDIRDSYLLLDRFLILDIEVEYPPSQALAALPIWMRSPDQRSSFRSTGQLVPSPLISVNSSFVPSTRNLDFSGSIGANSSKLSLYRLLSVVGRSREMPSGVNSTLALSLSIFFRYRETFTDVAVW